MEYNNANTELHSNCSRTFSHSQKAKLSCNANLLITLGFQLHPYHTFPFATAGLWTSSYSRNWGRQGSKHHFSYLSVALLLQRDLELYILLLVYMSPEAFSLLTPFLSHQLIFLAHKRTISFKSFLSFPLSLKHTQTNRKYTV
jgi:hypothetical protein